MHEHVVEHAAERVGGVLALRGVLDGLRDGDAEAAGESGSASRIARPELVSSEGLATTLAPQASIIERPVRLLLVRDLDHVDLALEPEELRGERDRAPHWPAPVSVAMRVRPDSFT